MGLLLPLPQSGPLLRYFLEVLLLLSGLYLLVDLSLPSDLLTRYFPAVLLLPLNQLHPSALYLPVGLLLLSLPLTRYFPADLSRLYHPFRP